MEHTLADTSPQTPGAPVRPTDDFFGFINNAWIQANPIPQEKASWGTLNILDTRVGQQLKEILDQLVTRKDLPPGSESSKLRDFYATAIDSEKTDRAGITPLAPLFMHIDAVTDTESLMRTVAELHRVGINALWTLGVLQDKKNSGYIALHFFQGGLSLPDRDYYLAADARSAEIREKYSAYVRSMLQGMGFPGALCADMLRAIMRIETKLAEASMTRVELRDDERQYNKMASPMLADHTPHMQWAQYFAACNVPMPKSVIVCQPAFLKAVDALFASTPIEDMRWYLRWRTLNDMAPFLDAHTERTRFEFYAKTFSGKTTMEPRWRRVLIIINRLLGEALGRLYVEKHFGAAAAEKIHTLVDCLVSAYHARIETLAWMSASTKRKAVEKLSAVGKKLGHPSVWKKYADLSVATDTYAANVMRASVFEFDREMKKIEKPVDRSEWVMPPQTINAYYNRTMNEIAFPAGILQPPLFDPNASDAENFGGIGTIIGHELTHGFDDKGSRFDANGNLSVWWTDDDRTHFTEKTAQLVKDYSACEPLPDAHINGELTLGENIADLGGLAIAHDGLLQALARTAATPQEKHRAVQQFFKAFAIVWRGYSREEALRTQLKTDPHAPWKYRVNIPLSNMDSFHEAFGSTPEDALWKDPSDRIAIW